MMKTLPLIFLSCCFATTLAACGSTAYAPTYAITLVDVPERNVIVTSELGDTLVEHHFEASTPSYRVLQEMTWHGDSVPAGTVLTPVETSDKYLGFRELGLCKNKSTGRWWHG